MYTIAIIGSIRRVARKPSVTAGLRCPEMRIVAVIMMPRMRPCAMAATTRPLVFCDIAEDMIDAPPTKTRAKMPMNSAAK